MFQNALIDLEQLGLTWIKLDFLPRLAGFLDRWRQSL
jgi:hypothetical protein